MRGKTILRRRVSAPGCDDAPHVEIEVDRTKPKPVTFVYPYYENPRMLAWQVGLWNSYPADLRDFLSVVVVDDGSPRQPAETVLRHCALSLPVALYRIVVDVRWNWLAARNLGVSVADRPDDWHLLTDMDHAVTPDVLDRLVYGRHDDAIIYRFRREEADGTPIREHPNSWLLTARMFWRTGGYDEALSGHYGTDGEFRRRCAATAPIRILTDRLVRHEFFMDASTTDYKRKQPEDAAVQRMVAARGPGWKPKTLSFPWTRVPL